MIQRYDPIQFLDMGCTALGGMEKTNDGDYVLFEDHETEMHRQCELTKAAVDVMNGYLKDAKDIKQKLQIAVDALTRCSELSTHEDHYWAIEEIERVADEAFDKIHDEQIGEVK